MACQAPTKRVVVHFVGLLALAETSACGLFGAPTDNNDNGPGTGQMVLALTNETGMTLPQMDWVLNASNGDVIAAGSVPIDPVTGVISLGLTLPVGSGNVLAMSGTTLQGVHCAGETAPFNVLSDQVSQVTLNLICGRDTPTPASPGQVLVSGKLVDGDSCPALGTWAVTPVAGSSPLTFSVDVQATDADPSERLSFTWTADSGTFSTPGVAHTQFICGPAGPSTLRLILSDNHAPVQCTLKVDFPPVNCP